MTDFASIIETPNEIWTPSGKVDLHYLQAKRAVEEYDSNLTLAKHTVTDDWVIFTRLDNGTLYPVIGLGRELPSPDRIKERIYKSDLRRRGEKMLDEMNRRNEQIRRNNRRAAEDATGLMAEALEYGYRKMEKHPVPRIFIPRGINAA